MSEIRVAVCYSSACLEYRYMAFRPRGLNLWPFSCAPSSFNRV